MDKQELPDLAESENTPGQLKIFLGMAAGVGKTHLMLEEAHQQKAEARDPVIGIVYTHARPDTPSLLVGLKKIAEKKIKYKDNEFFELDLEAILSLKPDIVLIDELAHTNIPGERHEKRWQDVLEILENGIDVYTTLNVQNIESLKDIIEGIVGITVRETIPDLIIEKASSIRFVDITPEELLYRLRDGKVYTGDQSKIAVEHFFQKDRLTALREIALRYAAEKVHLDLSRLPPITESRIDWKPREKFLVAVGQSPHSQKLIRTARRLASNVNAPWIALNVETGAAFNESESKQLDKNLTLASQLGAEVITVNNPSVIDGIKVVSREKGVTQVIIGRPPRISFFSMFTQSALIDQLAAECTDIDIHVIRQDRYNVSFHRRFPSFKPVSKFIDYFYALTSVAALSGLNVLLLPFLGYKAIGFIFLFGILLLSLVLKKGPIFFASLLFALIWNFFFIPPIGSFVVSDKEDIVLLSLYVVSALIIGILLERTRKHRDLLIRLQSSSEVLFDIVKAMAENEDIDYVFDFIKIRLSTFFDGTFDIVIRKSEKETRLTDTSSSLLIDEPEKNAFVWAMLNGKEAGWSTDTLPMCQNLYLPLICKNESIGLLIYKPGRKLPFSHDERKILLTICRQIASFIDRVQTEKQVKENEQLEQSEKIHGILLKRFSLLFEKPVERAKTALLSIKGNFKQHEIDEIENSLEIVTKTFSNVSAMSQLIEGLVPLEKEKHRANEIVEECCESVKKSYPECPIEFYSDSELPHFHLDYYLIKILIFNLLIFSIENSKPGSKVIVNLKRSNHMLELTIQSEGKKVPKVTADQFFDRDFVSTNEGLGLQLAKSIAEVHGGTLKAACSTGSQILFTFSISLDRIFFE